MVTLEVSGFIKLQPFTISRTPFPFRFVRKTTKTGPIRKSHANILNEKRSHSIECSIFCSYVHFNDNLGCDAATGFGTLWESFRELSQIKAHRSH